MKTRILLNSYLFSCLGRVSNKNNSIQFKWPFFWKSWFKLFPIVWLCMGLRRTLLLKKWQNRMLGQNFDFRKKIWNIELKCNTLLKNHLVRSCLTIAGFHTKINYWIFIEDSTFINLTIYWEGGRGNHHSLSENQDFWLTWDQSVNLIFKTFSGV